MTRITEYLQETHGARFELLRHFAGTMFESDLVWAPYEWKKAAIGFFAALISLGLVVVKTFSERCSLLQTPPSKRLIYGQELRPDEFLFIGIAMMVTALVTLLGWQALFPRLRDCLALASLTVLAGDVFAAKFTVLLMVFSGYALALTAPWALLFATATSGSWQENPSARPPRACLSMNQNPHYAVFRELARLNFLQLHLNEVAGRTADLTCSGCLKDSFVAEKGDLCDNTHAANAGGAHPTQLRCHDYPLVYGSDRALPPPRRGGTRQTGPRMISGVITATCLANATLPSTPWW